MEKHGILWRHKTVQGDELYLTTHTNPEEEENAHFLMYDLFGDTVTIVDYLFTEEEITFYANIATCC